MTIYFTFQLSFRNPVLNLCIYLDVQLSESLTLGAHPDSIPLDMVEYFCYSFFTSDKTKPEIRGNCRCDGEALTCVVQLVVS